MTKIKANVMYDWNRKTNPGCLFVPGDLVCPVNTHDSNICKSERVKRAKNKAIGRIVAVSCGDMENKLIRPKAGTLPSRYWTAYYIEFLDGKIYGYRSEFIRNMNHLNKV